MSTNLIFRKNETEYMKLCLDVTVYWTGSVFEHTNGVLNFYTNALDLIGRQLKYYATEEMSNSVAITGDELGILPRWLHEADRSRETLMLNLESNSVPNMPSDTALDFWAVEYPEQPAGMIRLILPVSFIQDSPKKLVDLAKRLTGEMDFHSGHGGYSINWDFKGDYAFSAKKEMAILSRRYPGIDLPEVACTLMAIPNGIKRVNWLTLIGNSLLDTLGGRDSFSKRLNDGEVKVESLPMGIIAVAGSEPKIGDVNRQESLASYYTVGKALAGIRNKEHPPFLINNKGFADDEVTSEWLSYFDE